MSRSLNRADFRNGLLFYAISSGLVLLALWFGQRFIVHPPVWEQDGKDFIGALCRYDGNWYLSIQVDGYSYDASRPSNVAFFPAHPLTARAIEKTIGIRPDLASLLVAHVFLAASFVLLHAYARIRRSCQPSSPQPLLVLMSLAIIPTGFFFRLGYTESMFIFWTLLILFGYERGWAPAWLALIAGAATATRAPGAALGFVVILTIWQRTSTWSSFLARLLPLGLLSGWGAFAYIGYQAIQFGEPLAFARTQVYWNSYSNQSPLGAVVSLLTLEPVWSTYVPGSNRGWWREDPYNITPFSMQLANPIYFLLASLAVFVGWRKGLLSRAEIWLGFGLLLIPYLTRAYPNSMGSFGRFSAVVVPAYFTYAAWFSRLKPAVLGMAIALCAVFLFAYAALFGAAWWLV